MKFHKNKEIIKKEKRKKKDREKERDKERERERDKKKIVFGYCPFTEAGKSSLTKAWHGKQRSHKVQMCF